MRFRKVAEEKQNLNKKEFLINFPKAISEFENAMHKFPVKKILYRSIFRGRGLEFDSYRTFSPDDDADMIDWKASLRSNDLLAKKYVEERDLSVYFLVDVSGSMLFGSGEKLKAEYCAEIVASLSHLVISSGDRAGLVLFNDKVVKVVHPNSNKNQFFLLTKFLSNPEFYGGDFDLNSSIEYVLKTVNSPYTIFILVSDFLRVRKNALRNLRLLGSRFETMAIVLRDPFDEELPNTKYQFAIQDPVSGRQMILDPAISGIQYKREVARQKAMLKDFFKKSQIDFLDVKTDKRFAVMLSSFLRNRARGGRI